LLFSIIGERLEEPSIVGLSLASREKKYTLTIWTDNISDVAVRRRVATKLARELGSQLEFKTNTWNISNAKKAAEERKRKEEEEEKLEKEEEGKPKEGDSKKRGKKKSHGRKGKKGKGESKQLILEKRESSTKSTLKVEMKE
ncbi:Translation Initiation factor eIF- 4e like protein, partial [Aduncisulcus paluster]